MCSLLLAITVVFTGPANWNDTYPKCGGKKQSPINIVEADVTYNSSLKALTLSDYNRTTGLTYELTNHGHTIQVNILKDGTSDKSPIMIGHKGNANYLNIIWDKKDIANYFKEINFRWL